MEDRSTSSAFEMFTFNMVFMCLFSGYIAYYFLFNVKKPVIACNYQMKLFLEKFCPIVNEKYWPAAWCLEPRIQTIVSSMFGSRLHIPYEREKLCLFDSGIVMLDWVLNNNSHIDSEIRPTVIILPGLVGSSQESYAKHLAHQSIALGFRVVVFNYRGKGGAELKTSRTYCAANSDDLLAVIEHVKKRYNSSKLFAVGVSLGGIILVNYLAKTGKLCHLDAAMTVSVAWNMFESASSLEQPVNSFVFNRMLTKQLKESVAKYENMFCDQCDLQKVFDSQTIRDFDESFTARMFGYDGHVSYYNDACIDRKLHDVQIPLLCLNAADDPFSPGEFIPVSEAHKSYSVAIMVTARGGHIAFLDGIFGLKQTRYTQRVFAQFFSAVYNHIKEFISFTDMQ